MDIYGAAALITCSAANACRINIIACAEFACSSTLRVDVDGVPVVDRDTLAGGQRRAVTKDKMCRAGYGNAAADGHVIAYHIPLAIFKSCGVHGDHSVCLAGVVAVFLFQRRTIPSHVGNGVDCGWRSVAIYLNLSYTFRLIRQNGCAIYFRRLILFRSFHHKWRFTVCCFTIGIVIKHATGDGISISRSDSCNPTISPPPPVCLAVVKVS